MKNKGKIFLFIISFILSYAMMNGCAYARSGGFLSIENATKYAEVFDRYLIEMGEYDKQSDTGIVYANLIDATDDGETNLIMKGKHRYDNDWVYVVYDGSNCIYNSSIPYKDCFTAGNDVSTVPWCVRRVNDRAFSGVTVQIGNEFIKLSEKPIIENERILILSEDIKDYLDIKCNENSITVKNDKGLINCYVGSKAAYMNGAEWEMEIAPKFEDGKLMIPLRFCMEKLGYTVDWNKLTKNVKAEAKKESDSFNPLSYAVIESRTIEPVVIARNKNEIGSIFNEFKESCNGTYRYYDLDEDREEELFLYPEEKGERRMHIYKYDFKKSTTLGYVMEYGGEIYTYPKKKGLLMVSAKNGEEIIYHIYFDVDKLITDKIYEKSGLENYIDAEAVFEGAEKLEFAVNERE